MPTLVTTVCDSAFGFIKALTDRKGQDHSPALSPNGKQIAYLGFDDSFRGYQVTHLYVMNRDGSGGNMVSGSLDRDVEQPVWSADGIGLGIFPNRPPQTWWRFHLSE